MVKNGLIIVLLSLVIVLVIHGQTVPKARMHSIQNGISLGLGIWAAPDPGLQAQAASTCASSGDAFACVNAQRAITKDAQERGLAFMTDVYTKYPNAHSSLESRNLWFNPDK